MSEYYTVDRANRLTSGLVFELEKHGDINPDFLQSHVDSMFPEGVSRHGDQYFLSNSAQANVASPAIELVFEYVRRAHFLTAPSRFQSWFGTDSVEAAVEFRNRFAPNSGARIWRIECNDVFRANMNLLTAADSALVQSWRAHQYWQGQAGLGDAFWEYLLRGTVRVLEPVPEADASAHENGT